MNGIDTRENNSKRYIRSFLTIGMATLMVLVAELIDEKEIIFPEIAALVVGAWYMKHQPWKVNKIKFVILMSLSAFVGIGIVRYIDVPLIMQVVIGLLFSVKSLTVSKTTLVPMISACILPLYLGTTSIIYPVSVFVMAFLIVFIQKVLQRYEYVDTVEYIKAWESFRHGMNFYLPRVCVFMLLACIPITMGKVYFVAPPLIVTFMEFSNCKAPIRNNYRKACILMVCAACLGTISRLVGYETLQIPLAVCAFVIIGILLMLFKAFSFAFPPVGAIAMLPLILKKDGLVWYPIFVSIGCYILIKVAILGFKEKKA